MYFGNRRIRSAGRSSGSVELTLPAQLQGLQEVECRLTLRDGAHPEIVLQPDLSAAHLLLQQIWQQLRLGLAEIDDIGDFEPAAFALSLFPPHHWQRRPPLAYVDALAVLRHGSAGAGRESLARLICFMSVEAGYRFGLNESLALAFGDTVGFLLLGIATVTGMECERGLAQRIFWGEHAPVENPPATLDAQSWKQAAAGLRRVWEQFDAWQRMPESYASARQKWYRALTLELRSGPIALPKPGLH